ncbi:GDP-L-fucose synthase [Simkania negevensis]|uniref:GDP-L-fucose synthase n=1 Tax=Simkania negevensis TaxID=83561 RepID=A0ABS3ARJ9_9BACT|nr:GDP-L-fucose synthase [Simkania negevensis]
MSSYLNSTVFIAGAHGMVGSALVQRFEALGLKRSQLLTPTHSELDCTDMHAADGFFVRYQPDIVVVAAALVGGIYANSTRPAEFFYENAMIAQTLIHAAYVHNVKRLVFLASSCMYPTDAQQPLREKSIFMGPPEKTNEAYALAKICGTKMCEYYHMQYGCDFFTVIPTSLYGPQESFDEKKCHVIPALVQRFHEAKEGDLREVAIWGTGMPLREYLYVDDFAEALCVALQHYHEPSAINIGSDEEVSIKELAQLIAEVVGYRGKIVCDTTKPDGFYRKKTDTEKFKQLGWKPKIPLREGLKKIYTQFLSREAACCSGDLG